MQKRKLIQDNIFVKLEDVFSKNNKNKGIAEQATLAPTDDENKKWQNLFGGAKL